MRFSQKVAKSEKVAFAFLFLQKVAKSVDRRPSQQKGGQYCAIFAKGGQVSRKVANDDRFSQKVAKSVERWLILCDFAKGGQVSNKVANVLRFLREVAKSVKRWPLYCYFRKRWPSQ